MAKASKKPRGEPAAPALPPTVKVQIVAGGREWHFRRRLAHALALPALLLALGFGLHALQLARLPGPPPRQALLQAHALSCLLLAAALHLGTLRWQVRIDAAGLGIDRSSWLWPRVHRLPLSALVGLKHRLSYTMTTNSGGKENTVPYHAVFAPQGLGRELKITPGLPGPASARTVAIAVIVRRRALRMLALHRNLFCRSLERAAPGAKNTSGHNPCIKLYQLREARLHRGQTWLGLSGVRIARI